jgi:hypothetical protein
MPIKLTSVPCQNELEELEAKIKAAIDEACKEETPLGQRYDPIEY